VKGYKLIKNKRILITGGLGFIGSAAVKDFLKNNNFILNIDKESYASMSHINNKITTQSKNYLFIKGDICNNKLVYKSINTFQPNYIINFAAETHVDRSIEKPDIFVKSNILGTQNLLYSSLKYFNNLSKNKKNKFRFIQISTDEVYGSLSKGKLFSEKSIYNPSSPYSASKASSDFLAKAYFKTYQLPVIITNCSNNFGIYQNPEKLIPNIILRAIKKKPLLIYGNGKNIRDWIHVDDHIKALHILLKKGKIGENYNIGSECEKSNIQIVKLICKKLEKMEIKHLNSYKLSKLITYVSDRPGHDKRYALNVDKIKKLGWKPEINFEKGLDNVVEWYAENSNKILKKNKLDRKGLL
jgi:dTDP-glucose 4,6-dehydratase